MNSYDGYPLDMLFMDIVLENEEGKNGIDIVTAVNKKWKDCQIVYLTNYLFYATEVYHTEHVFFALKEQFEERIGGFSEKCFINLPRQEKNSSILSSEGKKFPLPQQIFSTLSGAGE